MTDDRTHGDSAATNDEAAYCCGREVFRDGQRYADATSNEHAREIVDMLNGTSPAETAKERREAQRKTILAAVLGGLISVKRS